MRNKQNILESYPILSKEIGFYLSGMNEVRRQLFETVETLSNDEISHRFNENCNTIGELILHIGEAEWWWFQCAIAGKELTETDKKIAHWDVLKNRSYSHYSTQDCLNAVTQIRQQTTEVLANFADEDLEVFFAYETDWSNGKNEASLRWILYHLTEHEAHHRGQISMIKKLIRN